MQVTAGGGASVQSDDRDDSYRSIVSDLKSLMERVQASMRLIEQAIAGEQPPGNQEVAADIVVPDDVTPRYVRANAALKACNAGLGVALHFLLDTRTAKAGTGEAATLDRPAGLTGRA